MRRFLKIKAKRTNPDLMPREKLIAKAKALGCHAVCVTWPDETLRRKIKEKGDV